MRKTLLATAAIGMLTGPALAEPLTLDNSMMDEITAGSGYGVPMVPLDFGKNVHLSDIIKNQVHSMVESTVYLHGNVATSEGAATAIGPNTFTSATFGANTVAGGAVPVGRYCRIGFQLLIALI